MNSSQINSTNTRAIDQYKEPPGLVIARLSFESAIALAGVIGNILVCIVIASKRLRGRTSMHYYLLNLALADIGVLIILFPLGVLKERMPGYWPFGRIVCLYVYPFTDTFYGASIWFITSIAFQRYRKIVKTKAIQGESSSTKRMLFNLISIWLVSFLVVSFPLFFVYEYTVNVKKGQTLCAVDWQKAPHFFSFKVVFTVCFVAFSYVIPLAVISWTYVGIWQEIRKSNLFHQNLDRESGSTNNKAHKRLNENARAKKILTPIVVIFAITMLPVNVFRLLTVFWVPMIYRLRHFWTFYNAMVIVTTANSAANPIIYSVVSRDFRKAFIKLILERKSSVASRLPSKSDVQTKVTSDKHRKKSPDTALSTKNWPDANHLKETVL